MAFRFWAKPADHHIHLLCVLRLNSRWANIPAGQIGRVFRDLALMAPPIKKVRDVPPESL
jgi:hypothetical protein